VKISKQRIVHLPPRVFAVVANLTMVPNRSIFWYRTRNSMPNQ
jgi:integrase